MSGFNHPIAPRGSKRLPDGPLETGSQPSKRQKSNQQPLDPPTAPYQKNTRPWQSRNQGNRGNYRSRGDSFQKGREGYQREQGDRQEQNRLNAQRQGAEKARRQIEDAQRRQEPKVNRQEEEEAQFQLFLEQNRLNFSEAAQNNPIRHTDFNGDLQKILKTIRFLQPYLEKRFNGDLGKLETIPGLFDAGKHAEYCGKFADWKAAEDFEKASSSVQIAVFDMNSVTDADIPKSFYPGDVAYTGVEEVVDADAEYKKARRGWRPPQAVQKVKVNERPFFRDHRSLRCLPMVDGMIQPVGNPLHVSHTLEARLDADMETDERLFSYYFHYLRGSMFFKEFPFQLAHWDALIAVKKAFYPDRGTPGQVTCRDHGRGLGPGCIHGWTGEEIHQGTVCLFSHDLDAKRPRPRLCGKYNTEAGCLWGDQCKFLHIHDAERVYTLDNEGGPSEAGPKWEHDETNQEVKGFWTVKEETDSETKQSFAVYSCPTRIATQEANFKAMAANEELARMIRNSHETKAEAARLAKFRIRAIASIAKNQVVRASTKRSRDTSADDSEDGLPQSQRVRLTKPTESITQNSQPENTTEPPSADDTFASNDTTGLTFVDSSPTPTDASRTPVTIPGPSPKPVAGGSQGEKRKRDEEDEQEERGDEVAISSPSLKKIKTTVTTPPSPPALASSVSESLNATKTQNRKRKRKSDVEDSGYESASPPPSLKKVKAVTIDAFFPFQAASMNLAPLQSSISSKWNINNTSTSRTLQPVAFAESQKFLKAMTEPGCSQWWNWTRDQIRSYAKDQVKSRRLAANFPQDKKAAFLAELGMGMSIRRS